MQQQQEQNDILEAEVRSLRLESSVKLQSDSELVKSLILAEDKSTSLLSKVPLNEESQARLLQDPLLV